MLYFTQLVHALSLGSSYDLAFCSRRPTSALALELSITSAIG